MGIDGPDGDEHRQEQGQARSADKDTGVSFDDVAGCDEAKYELQEVVDFLKNPRVTRRWAQRFPRACCSSVRRAPARRCWRGPSPAKPTSRSSPSAAASSWRCSSASGPSRVRDLFEQAKKHAPCIIFIDEIDAIGRQRSVHVGPVNDEREQTLNQLLVEMDGFEANVGVHHSGRHQPARRSSTGPCCGPAASTGRWSSTRPTSTAARRS